MSGAETTDQARQKRLARRVILGVSSALALLIVFGGGWVAASMFQSPEQRAAAQVPPPPAEITAEATSGTLAETVNAQGTVERSSLQSAILPTASDANITVVTRTPAAAGAAVVSGQQVLEVNGRPLIALPGTFPFYRDLAEGYEGPDVRQFQDALIAAGYSLRADGQFGPATVAATTALYKDLGYPAPLTLTGASPDIGSEADSETASPPTSAPGTAAGPTAQSLLVPARELVVVSAVPAQLATVPGMGTVVGAETTISFSSGTIVVRAQVAESIAGSISEGTAATIAGPGGVETQGTVAGIVLGAPGENAVVTVTPSDSDLLETWSGSSVLLTFTLQVVAENSLIVPSSAIQSHGSGDTFVLKQVPSGGYEKVNVEEVGSLSGRSAISPRSPGELQAGDTVRIG